MNVGSLFSGIGGLDYGLARAGFRHAFLCESDPWRREVLANHFPGTPIFEDVRAVGEPAGRTAADGCGAPTDRGRWEAGTGLLCGGFPCQDVSIAGRRAGLAGVRSGLFHEFVRIAESLRPQWLLVENVPGLLSSNGGRDFGVVLGTLADIGYGVAWRILDSRYFGVPQRRRRVFVLGALADGDPRGAAERCGQILAVGTRCDWHPATRGKAGPSVAPALSGRSASRLDDQGSGQLVSAMLGSRRGHDEQASYWIEDFENGTLTSSKGRIDRHPLVAAPLSHGSNPNSNMAGRRREDDKNLIFFDTEFSNQGEPSEHAVLTRKLRRSIASPATGVRRLTPRECERLQALPDDWTALGADSRRYAALGDAVTASVAEWIGRRILAA